ncbi:MAG: aldolase/citrate lyase family protein [Lysobacterales bacterium]
MTELKGNRFLAGLKSSNPQYGLWLGIPDPSIAEMMACAGFDWLVIDHEHGPFELRDVLHHLQAMAPYTVAPIVRPVDDNPGLLKKLCDIGAQSFLVPMIETADQAAALVGAVKYPPEGTRGMGTSMARAARWNMTPNYVENANQQMCVIAQVETVAGLQNLEAITNTQGLDGVFFGPSDLSASMGYVGNPTHPEVAQAVETGIKAVSDAGKFAGLLCLDETEVPRYLKAGASFVGVGLDTLLIGNAARALAAKFSSSHQSEPTAGY